jgi:hypothetical protein
LLKTDLFHKAWLIIYKKLFLSKISNLKLFSDMKIKHHFLALLIGLAFTAFACNMGTTRVTEETLPPGTHKVVIDDILHTSTYTYLNVEEKGTAFWIAIPKREDLQKGKTYYYSGGYEMPNFQSKELDRTFETLYLVQEVTETHEKTGDIMQTPRESGKRTPMQEEALNIKPGAGEISVADLYSQKASYAGKTVKIRGKIVKYNAGIMGKNWAHIQDGSKFENYYDLTVTTMDNLNPGDVVVFEGVISLDKDFGAGYTYEVIMEDAKATPSTSL